MQSDPVKNASLGGLVGFGRPSDSAKPVGTPDGAAFTAEVKKIMAAAEESGSPAKAATVGWNAGMEKTAAAVGASKTSEENGYPDAVDVEKILWFAKLRKPTENDAAVEEEDIPEEIAALPQKDKLRMGNELISHALKQIAAILGLPEEEDASAAFEFDPANIEQLAAIMAYLDLTIKMANDRIDVSANAESANIAMAAYGMESPIAHIEPEQNAAELSEFAAALRTEKFRMDMAFRLIGVSGMIAEKMAEHGEAGGTAVGIPQAINPANLGMSVSDTVSAFSSLIREELSASADRVRQIVRGQADMTDLERAAVELGTVKSEILKAALSKAKAGDSTFVKNDLNINVNVDDKKTDMDSANANVNTNGKTGINTANVKADVNTSVNTSVNTTVNTTNVKTDVNPDINTTVNTANVKSDVNPAVNTTVNTNNVKADVNTAVNPTVNTTVNTANVKTDVNPDINTTLNTVNVKTDVNTTVNPMDNTANAKADVNTGVNPAVNTTINTTNVKADVNPDVDTTVNTANVKTDVNPAVNTTVNTNNAKADVNTGVNLTVNTTVNTANVKADDNPDVNTTVNTANVKADVNPAVNTNADTVVNANNDKADVNTTVNTKVNADVNTEVKTDVNTANVKADVDTAADKRVNADVQTETKTDVNTAKVKADVNTGVNATNTTVNTDSKADVNTDVNTTVNTANVKSGVNTDVNTTVNTEVKAEANTANANIKADVNPANVNTSANTVTAVDTEADTASVKTDVKASDVKTAVNTTADANVNPEAKASDSVQKRAAGSDLPISAHDSASRRRHSSVESANRMASKSAERAAMGTKSSSSGDSAELPLSVTAMAHGKKAAKSAEGETKSAAAELQTHGQAQSKAKNAVADGEAAELPVSVMESTEKKPAEKKAHGDHAGSAKAAAKAAAKSVANAVGAAIDAASAKAETAAANKAADDAFVAKLKQTVEVGGLIKNISGKSSGNASAKSAAEKSAASANSSLSSNSSVNGIESNADADLSVDSGDEREAGGTGAVDTSSSRSTAAKHADKAETPAVSQDERLEVIRQISEKLNNAVRSGANEIRMVLRPEALGEVRMSLRVQGDVVFARMQVENKQVKAIVESSLQSLKDSLNRQNLEFGAIDVEVGAQSDGDRSPREIWQEMADRAESRGFRPSVGVAVDGTPIDDDSNGFVSNLGSDTGRRFGDNTFEYFA
ncbi:MAG: flagellar hook-length control protein FliK [Chitinispirillales bacterium]|jgi:flagellar hook-length control protein FliK|nr:flagellar hook-length control protein FliK [Chitinispirillales bacterium]